MSRRKGCGDAAAALGDQVGDLSAKVVLDRQDAQGGLVLVARPQLLDGLMDAARPVVGSRPDRFGRENRRWAVPPE